MTAAPTTPPVVPRRRRGLAAVPQPDRPTMQVSAEAAQADILTDLRESFHATRHAIHKTWWRTLSPATPTIGMLGGKRIDAWAERIGDAIADVLASLHALLVPERAQHKPEIQWRTSRGSHLRLRDGPSDADNA